MSLFLVRHGRPAVDRSRPASTWVLDPAGYDDIWALRASGRLPGEAVRFSSPEPKAVETAQLLFDGEVGLVEGLREHVRETSEWLEDFEGAVRRAFAVPDAVAVPGWEPLADCRDRVVRAVDGILSAHPHTDVVLVGHGTAWTLVVAALTGAEPDLERWRGLAMPDVITVEPGRGDGAGRLGSRR